MITLLNKDCKYVLKQMRPVRMIFADPPDNIGLKYSAYDDDLSVDAYRAFIEDIIYLSMFKCDVFWLSYNAKHTYMVGSVVDYILKIMKDWQAKPFVQTFTFGQYRSTDCGNNHRPLLRLKKKKVKLYPEAIKVPSWRLLHGDKRANPEGRVPGDVLDMPRVTGNSKQRRKWHPTQLNEDLYERCIKLSCKEGDTVCDLFAGTGTLARVAEKCGVNALLVEIDETYCEKIAEEHNLEYYHDD